MTRKRPCGPTSGRRRSSRRGSRRRPTGTTRRSRRRSTGTGRTRRASSGNGCSRRSTRRRSSIRRTGSRSRARSATSRSAGSRTPSTRLKALSKPFLDWAGKAERLSFDVPTLPLFVHERLSTKAILETLKGTSATGRWSSSSSPTRSCRSHQQLEAYEHKGGWVNRMILGDSLVVMNSLLEYEGLGGQVQMIYIDPPYGVKFGSNFQPFVRTRDVKNSDDADMTREPEMVKAYRDTWELGLHSYLTYLRDRLARRARPADAVRERLRSDLATRTFITSGRFSTRSSAAENFCRSDRFPEDDQCEQSRRARERASGPLPTTCCGTPAIGSALSTASSISRRRPGAKAVRSTPGSSSPDGHAVVR